MPSPEAFVCERCLRPLKVPAVDGLGPTCHEIVHGPSLRLQSPLGPQRHRRGAVKHEYEEATMPLFSLDNETEGTDMTETKEVTTLEGKLAAAVDLIRWYSTDHDRQAADSDGFSSCVCEGCERAKAVFREAPVTCPKCDGCGLIADSDDGEAWTLWASLPPGSNAAVVMGIVKPIPRPKCSG